LAYTGKNSCHIVMLAVK